VVCPALNNKHPDSSWYPKALFLASKPLDL
jgi:hypothetical protein